MDPVQIAEQLPVLLGAGAGAAAKGAAGAAGKAAFDRLRERLRRQQPAEADRLDRMLEDLGAVSSTLGEMVEDNEEIRQALDDLAGSVEVSLVAGSQLLNYGHIDKSLIARDINTVNM
jgi:hypothetical protein